MPVNVISLSPEQADALLREGLDALFPIARLTSQKATEECETFLEILNGQSKRNPQAIVGQIKEDLANKLRTLDDPLASLAEKYLEDIHTGLVNALHFTKEDKAAFENACRRFPELVRHLQETGTLPREREDKTASPFEHLLVAFSALSVTASVVGFAAAAMELCRGPEDFSTTSFVNRSAVGLAGLAGALFLDHKRGERSAAKRASNWAYNHLPRFIQNRLKQHDY